MTSASALCHEWLTTFGGSDQVAARLAQMLGVSQVFTYAAREDMVAQLFPATPVRVIGPQHSLAQRRWQWFLPHMPFAWGRVDLSRFDLVVTSSHSAVNAIRPRRDALLVSYCHTPMRYAWEWRAELERLPWPVRPVWPLVASRLRAADRRWSQRVDLFLANSRFVAGRIGASYGRGSLVVHPPIETTFWCPAPGTDAGGYFLLSGRVVAYKRPDLVVEAARQAGVELVVAGDGPMLPSLRSRAPGNVRFVVQPTSEELRALYRGARAYVFAGVEDFGMSIVEAQACGTPVIALAEGGALETVTRDKSGVLVERADVEGFADAMRSFEPDGYDRAEVRDSVLRFDGRHFDESVRWAVGRARERDWKALSEHPQWVHPPS